MNSLMNRRMFGAVVGSALSAAAGAQVTFGLGAGTGLKLVVGYPPGQLTDVVARTVADGLSAELKEIAIVENRPGAGQLLAATYVARSAPNGATSLVFGMAAMVIVPHVYQKKEIDPYTALKPVGRVMDTPMLLLASAKAPFKTVSELVAYAKANPGKLSYGSAGVGVFGHLCMEEFKRQAKIDMVHVPYQGSARLVPDMVRGEIAVAFDTLSLTKPLIESGQLRILGVGNEQRLSNMPAIPTIAEQGYPEFIVPAWVGMSVPSSTPDNVAMALSAALKKVLNRPETAEKFAAFSATVPRSDESFEDFRKFVAQEHARWGKVVAISGAKID